MKAYWHERNKTLAIVAVMLIAGSYMLIKVRYYEEDMLALEQEILQRYKGKNNVVRKLREGYTISGQTALEMPYNVSKQHTRK